MSEKTNVMRVLDAHKIKYEFFHYNPDPTLTGADIARILGEAPEEVFKTLVTTSKSGKNYVFMIPVERELDLKKAAAAVGEKSVEMLKSRDLLPLTGYVHGGCSPVGMKKNFKTFIDATAKNFPLITFSGGKVGAQVRTSLEDLCKVVNVRLADISK